MKYPSDAAEGTISRAMEKLGRFRWRLVRACALLSIVGAIAQGQSKSAQGKVAILSSSRPTDSLGETVYEFRNPGEQNNEPPVAGAFVPPAPLKQSVGPPEYPESMRKKKENGAVVVEGVVAQDGRFIDVKVFSTTDAAFDKNAVKAATQYQFQPATLDGKPIACLIRVRMTFAIH